MSYAMAKLIWGIPLTEDAAIFAEGEADSYDFELLYSGSADWEPGYLGVDLGEIDTIDHQKLEVIEDMKKKLTEKEKEDVLRKIKGLDPEIKACYTKEELVPNFWIIWFTS